MSDKRGASIGRFRLQHTHTEGRREGGFYSADSAAGISAAQLPGTLREEEPRGSPPSQHGVPRRGWPLCPPRPSVSLFFLGGSDPPWEKGSASSPVQLQPHREQEKFANASSPGEALGHRGRGITPPGGSG